MLVTHLICCHKQSREKKRNGVSVGRIVELNFSSAFPEHISLQKFNVIMWESIQKTHGCDFWCAHPHATDTVLSFNQA